VRGEGESLSDQTIRLFAHADIDMKSAQSIFRQLDGKAVLSSLQRITEGGSTSNYILSLKDNDRKFLLKLYPEDGGNGALEVAAYRYAMQYARVPEVFLFDDSLSVFHRPYAIIQFIEGIGLAKYITEHKRFPESMARSIGSKLALLHGREYSCMSLLDASLKVHKELIPVSALHVYYLNGKPGSLVDTELRDDILGFIQNYPGFLERLAEHAVFCHGDFSPGNMIIDDCGEVWFIDFEYCLAAPVYYDIGKFFRDRPGVSEWFTEGVYCSFIGGYNEHTKQQLREDWYKLSRLMDMTSLLHLLNFDNAICWLQEIVEQIGHSMRLLRGIDYY
jgi:tRNA A-37 threonylcarbamoyl transferase component Bud32